MGSAQIEILNWDKFNPRSDVKASSWFRFEHNVFFDPEWDSFDGMEIAVWSYLLAFASFKRGKCKFDYDSDAIAKYARVPVEKVFSAIEKLVEKQCIKLSNHASVTRTVRARNVDVSLRYGTDGTDGTDGITASGDAGLSPKGLVEVWNLNCKTLPKVRGLTALRAQKARAALSRHPEPTYWLDVIAKFTGSKFCTDTWRPGFDDLLNETKRTRALEGNYDNKNHDTTNPDFWAEARRIAETA